MKIIFYVIIGLAWTVWATRLQLKYNPYCPICNDMKVFLLNFLFWPWFVSCSATRTPEDLAKFYNGKFLNKEQIYDVEQGIKMGKWKIDEFGSVEFSKQIVYDAYKAMGMRIIEDDCHWLKTREKWEEEHKNDPIGHGGD